MRLMSLKRKINIKGDITMQPRQRGEVFFDTQPHGAQIYVDGQLLIDPDTEESLRTPEKVLIFEGRHDFTFVLEGHKDASGYLDIYTGTTVSIFRNMEPGKSEEGWGEPEQQIWLSEQNTGTIRVYSEPYGANIYIDGNSVRDQSGNIVKTPVTITDIPVGDHQITFIIPGYLDEMKIVRIHHGELSDITAIMRPDFSKYR